MPQVFKVSRHFSESLGDEVAEELVTILNTLDQAYRTEIRDLFDAHLMRVNDRFNQVDLRFNQLEARFTERLEQMEIRINLRTDQKLEALKSDLLRWMFLFWVANIGTTIALLKL